MQDKYFQYGMKSGNERLVTKNYSDNSAKHSHDTSAYGESNGDGTIKAVYRSKKYILLLETLEKLTIFKI